MKPFLAMLGVNFKRLLLTTFSTGRGKRKAATGVGALVFMCLLMLSLSGTYSVLFSAIMAPLGGLDIMLMVMLLLGILAPFMFNVFAAQSLIFSTKDMDITLSLPVSAFSIMLSRVLALYLEVLLMTQLFILPAGICWLAFGGGGGVVFLLLLIIFGFFLALVPTLASMVFGTLIALLVSRLRFKNLFTFLFSILGTAALVWASTYFSISMTSDTIDFAAMRAALLGAFPPLGWMATALTGPNILLYLAIIIPIVLVFMGVTWLFSLFFKPLLTMLASHTLKNNFKLGQVASTRPFAALLGKEARKFFGTPIYLLNVGLMPLIVIGGSIFALTQRGNINGFWALLTQMEGAQVLFAYVPYVLLGIIAFFQATGSSTASSISLEGKTLWILKAAPLSIFQIFAAKITLNALLWAVAVVISFPLLGFAFSLPVGTVLLCMLLSFLFSVLISCVGLFVNLLLPRMDAENDTIVVKQSASIIVTMLANLVCGGLVVLLAILLMNHLPFALFALLGAAALGLLLAAVIALLATKGKQAFAAL